MTDGDGEDKVLQIGMEETGGGKEGVGGRGSASGGGGRDLTGDGLVERLGRSDEGRRSPHIEATSSPSSLLFLRQ